MSIVPASRLSASELAVLGNNIGPAMKKNRREIHAVNRSLAAMGEQVARLYARKLGSFAVKNGTALRS